MESTLKFILHNVHEEDHQEVKPIPKFTAKSKKKTGGRLQTLQTYEGYTIKLANTSCISFEGESKGHCWWDHHPYDGDLICMPYIHTQIRNPGHQDKHTFIGLGSFCSMFCLWSYVMEEMKKQYHLRDSRIETVIELTRLAFSLMFDTDVVLKCSPDWKLLDTYGGPLSVTHFRKASYDKTYTPLGNIVFKPALVSYLTQ